MKNIINFVPLQSPRLSVFLTVTFCYLEFLLLRSYARSTAGPSSRASLRCEVYRGTMMIKSCWANKDPSSIQKEQQMGETALLRSSSQQPKQLWTVHSSRTMQSWSLEGKDLCVFASSCQKITIDCSSHNFGFGPKKSENVACSKILQKARPRPFGWSAVLLYTMAMP